MSEPAAEGQVADLCEEIGQGPVADDLRLDGRAVALASLVFVPDDGVVARSVAKRRDAIALELDKLLASVRGDARSGDEAHVAVEVFSATDPVRKHGILRVAGGLTEAALPRVEVGCFSAGCP